MPRSNRPYRIAMIPTDTSGVNYYRMAAWAKEMRKHRWIDQETGKAHHVEVAMYGFQYDTNERALWQLELLSVPDIRERIECLIRACDVAIWQPVHYDHTLDFFNECRHKYGKYTIVETDDNYVDVPPWNEAQSSFRPGARPRAIAIQSLLMADAVTVTTPHLAETNKKFNENIHIIENSLDFIGDSKFVGWDKVSVRRHRGIRLGWIGGRCHYEDLLMVSPALREILERYPEVTLCLVNSAFEDSCKLLGVKYPFAGLKNVGIFDRSVPINRYAEFAASFGFDIGIAPLVDCNFNRSKSNLRWLEYSGLKIPTIATDISHFRQSIRDGQDGFLVKNNDLQDWVTRIGILIRDKGLRESIGRNAYKRVKADFNVKRNAPKYTRLLKELSDFSIEDPEYRALPNGQYLGVGAN